MVLSREILSCLDPLLAIHFIPIRRISIFVDGGISFSRGERSWGRRVVVEKEAAGFFSCIQKWTRQQAIYYYIHTYVCTKEEEEEEEEGASCIIYNIFNIRFGKFWVVEDYTAVETYTARASVVVDRNHEHFGEGGRWWWMGFRRFWQVRAKVSSREFVF